MAYELYAKVEHLLGIEEATQTLHASYLDVIDEFNPKTLLDVGCGQGAFLKALKNKNIAAVGIDLSHNMVARAKEKGLSAECKDIKETAGSFEMITAVFDVLNFLDTKALKEFFSHVERLLEPGGYFLADINTLFGFEAVAQGCMVYHDDVQSLSVEALFEANRLETQLVYFSKQEGCFMREKEHITQYYYTIEKLMELTQLKLISEIPIALYDDEIADKSMLLFQKEL